MGIRRFMQFSSFNQSAGLLATRDGFRWGRSCGVGMWSPVTSVLLGAAVGSCLFFIFALAMLYSPESKSFCPFCNHFLKKSEPLGFCPRWGYLAFNLASSAFSGLVTLSSISFCFSTEAASGTSGDILLAPSYSASPALLHPENLIFLTQISSFAWTHQKMIVIF